MEQELPDLLDMYERMLLIRYFEEEGHRRLRAGQMYGEIHQYIGEEAVAVGVCSALNPDDVITSTHRGHGHIVARGGDVGRMMAELYGKSTGYCKGKGGSFHVADVALGIYGANGIVGAGVPHAVGAAMAARLRHEPRVAVAFFGDGAMNQGVVHEALNLAASYQLPVIFVCENNGWAVSYSIKEATNIHDLAARAAGYGMPGRVVDGMDVASVYEHATEAVAAARSGQGPQFIEAKTYRYEGHFSAEESLMAGRPYRTKQTIAMWKAKDPLETCRRMILALELADGAAVEEIEKKAFRLVMKAADDAHSAPAPDPSEAYDDLYATNYPGIYPKGW